MNTLKPCPFCGEQVFTPLVSSLDDGYTRCISCGAKMQRSRWQARPIEGKLRKRIAELEAARRWRVVADGEMPEHDGEYWVWLEAWNTPDKRGACIYSKDYHDNNGFFNLIPVTHWMPLPQPPEVK